MTGAPHFAGAPSVLCAYGSHEADQLAACGIDGQFVPPFRRVERGRWARAA